ncbi:MAG: hypothetical protein ABI162_07100 [Luteolibacter sp.]
MPLTVAQARAALASYTSNGVGPTDYRFLPLLNEAQSRLYETGPYLGTLLRYAVLCQKEGDTTFFVLPTTLKTPTRVANYTGGNATLPGLLLSDGVGAFVHQTNEILSVNPTFVAGKWTVPAGTVAVDVTGDKIFKNAVLDSDLLMIDDISALKLMLLALWRENNDRLDVAMALEQKAVNRLKVLTGGAVDEARRLNYQSLYTSYAYGTVGWARMKLGTDMQQGISRDDAYIMDLLNKAEDMLIARYNFFILSNRLGVKDNLPKLNYTPLTGDTTPLPIEDYQIIKLMAMSMQAENSNDGNALKAAMELEQQAYDLLERQLKVKLLDNRRFAHEADYALFRDQPRSVGYFRTRLSLDLSANAGLLLTDDEMLRAINEAEEWAVMQGGFKGTRTNYSLQIDQSGMFIMPTCIEKIYAAAIGGTFAPVWGIEADYHQNGIGYSIGDCPGFGNRVIHRGEKDGRALYYVRDACAPECAHLLVKLRFVAHVNDSEDMIIVNYPAIKAHVESQLSADPNISMAKQKLALQLLESQLKESQGSDRMSLQVQNVGSFGSIRNLI